MNIVKEKRAGFFKISRDLIDKEPEIVMAVLTKVLVTDVEHDFISGVIKYRGYSEHFSPVDEGQIIPVYDIWINTKKDQYEQTVVTNVRFEQVIEQFNALDHIFKDFGNVRLIQKED